ncbi:trypsin-like peptidase domain-containing protein [Streptomyces sp. NPDC050504]|uniref:VMAP-C domain-containing protein n=1 Tax=Streptomyces sp. NPDC050504 TaxID=3365618 RepID=UPI00379F264D
MAGRDTLWQLAKDATVGIRPAPAPDPAPGRAAAPAPLWGSGFLVTPGWVLTCAHVLVSPDGRPRTAPDARPGEPDVGVVVDGTVLPGRFAYCMPRRGLALPGTGGEPGGPEPFADAVEGITPDLALIALLAPVPRPSCVWLTDRPPGEFSDDGGGGIIGRRYDSTRPDAPFVAEQIKCDYGGQVGSRISLRLSADMRHGVSGGPLVDLEHGEVVGVVKGRHRNGRTGVAVAVSELRHLTSAAHLPGAPSLGDEPYHELTRLHDVWHEQRQQPELGDGEPTWIDGQRELPGRKSGWTEIDRLIALEKLGRLPPPRSADVVRRAVSQAVRRTRERELPVPIRTWRDGHGELRGFGSPGDLAVHLRYLSLVAQEVHGSAGGSTGGGPDAVAAAQDLHDWAMSRGHGLDPAERPQLGEIRLAATHSVLLQFDLADPDPYPEATDPYSTGYADPYGPYGRGTTDPYADPYGGAYGDRYGAPVPVQPLFTWSVLTGDGTGNWELAVQAAEGLPFEQARNRALHRLGDILFGADYGRAADDPVRLEVALPGDWFGSDLDCWEVAELPGPGRRRTEPLGNARPVVLRSVERRIPLHTRDAERRRREEWLGRWRRLLAAPRPEPLRLAVPRAPARPDELRAASGGAVPVLCREVADGAGYEAAQSAVGVGYPVALWRSDGHQGAGECPPDCADFHDRVARLLAAETTVRTLPGTLWRLRMAAGRAGDPAAQWVRGVVLFYDDPGNPLPAPAGPLEQPGPRDWKTP